ncbi:MAG TPA: FAD-binding oxidoreductase [Sporolactobacillaceae bacterium]|nr:FAD-binding oxidoreductase [Sporolactobacillaceae bacterium]
MENLLDALKDIPIQPAEEKEWPFGNRGAYVVAPKTEAEMSWIVKQVNEANQTLNIVGGGTKQGFGGQHEKADLLMTLSNYKGIIEHSIGDMTMTVRAGTPMGDIARLLAEKGQMVPVDPAWPKQATIGGVIAANESGPKRLKYGSARDFVIGLRVVYPDGRIIRTGGKVVKNVAGYDMNKLFIGSMGTLGVISEITMKLKPISQYESLLHFQFSKEDIKRIESFVQELLHSQMEPVAIEFLNPRLNQTLFQKEAYGLLISFEDHKKSVEAQEKWVFNHCPSGIDHAIYHQEEAKEVWQRFSIIGPSPVAKVTDERIAIKIGSKTNAIFSMIETCDQFAAKWEVNVEAHGGAGHGLSKAFVEGHTDNLIAFINDIRDVAERASGYVVCTHLPFWLRQKVNVWGDVPSHFFLLEGIKRAVDPNNYLNIGRFIGGI